MTKQHFQYFIGWVEHDMIMFQCDNGIILKIAQLIKKKNLICLDYYIFLEFNFSS